MGPSCFNIADAQEAAFHMKDIGRKRPTRRTALACGRIKIGSEAYLKIKDNRLPKGNVLALAEIAGVMAAKGASSTLPLCHPLPLDHVAVNFVMHDDDCAIMTYAQVGTHAKTGVEMEALAAVNAALLSIWDMVKGVHPDLTISDIQLLVKTGGKSGIWKSSRGIPQWLEAQMRNLQCLSGISVATLVMSDRASRGDYVDQSGKVLSEKLHDLGATIVDQRLIPDDFETIGRSLRDICDCLSPDLLITSGGTGPGPRDVTPEALKGVADRMLEGLGDYIRQESMHYTDTAWLSRTTAAMVNRTLVVSLPGSPGAVTECLGIIAGFLADAVLKIKKQGYGG